MGEHPLDLGSRSQSVPPDVPLQELGDDVADQILWRGVAGRLAPALVPGGVAAFGNLAQGFPGLFRASPSSSIGVVGTRVSFRDLPPAR